MEKGHVLKEPEVTILGRKEEEVGPLLLRNDKNNVIVDYLFTKLVFCVEAFQPKWLSKGLSKVKDK